jgi:hypothetical protein
MDGRPESMWRVAFNPRWAFIIEAVVIAMIGLSMLTFALVLVSVW